MTSTADLPRAGRHPSWLRTGLLVALLALFATQSPPWSVLWAAVPGAVAISLLAGWRFGRWSVLIPLLLLAGAVALEGDRSLWVWWIPAASLTGVWMGLREEGGNSNGAGRAWMLLPMLLLAVGLPWLLRYSELIGTLDRELRSGDRQLLDLARELGSSGERLASMERGLEENAKLRSQALPHLLPTLLFVWMAVLAALGRTVASRVAGALRWPALARGGLPNWRLPDGAVWLFLAGLGLLLAPWGSVAPAGWTLLLNSGLGYCVQGIAVVESLMLARGVPLSVIVVTMAFVFALAMPVFMLTTVAVGLSDVWLDYRRIEAPPDSEQS